MFLTPNDHVSDTFVNHAGNKGFEAWLRQEMYETLFPKAGKAPKDPLVLDVGTNIGDHLLFLGALKIRSHGFEPNDLNFNVLECSIDANPQIAKYSNIYHFGVTDVPVDDACMLGPADNMGGTGIVLDRKCNEDGVKLVTLDNFWINQLKREHVFMMKIDIEGFEGKAFLGAQKMFREKPPVYIYMEFTPSSLRNNRTPPEELLKKMNDYGYIAYLNNACVIRSCRRFTHES